MPVALRLNVATVVKMECFMKLFAFKGSNMMLMRRMFAFFPVTY
jgi:hypothetical protein